MRRTSHSPDELREMYRDSYVRGYHQTDRGRLGRLLPLMRLERDMTVADLGCGNGLLAELVHDRVSRYHGVDFSSEFIEAAQQRQEESGIANVSFHCQSIEAFCDEHAGVIDVACAMDFAEHVYDEQLVAIAGAVRRCLRPGGRLLAHTPNARFVIEIMKNRGMLRQFPEHVAVRSAAEYRALFERAGFDEVRVTYLRHYVPAVAWLHAFSRFPVLGAYFKARLFLECTTGSDRDPTSR